MARREQQHFVLWVMLLALASILFTTDANAATNLHDPSGTYTSLLDIVKNSAGNWDAKLRVYATRLFWLLASIQFVWTFFPLVFKQADFGEIVGELIRFIMVIGFFYALLLFSADWAEAVVNSFRQAGATAAGLGTTGIKPGDIFATAVDLANTVGSVETWNPLTALLIALSALVVLLCFAFIAAFMGLTIIESFVVINASALFMGFGASQWTREYAMAIVRYAVSVGAKLFMLTLIVGLIIDSAKAWAAAYSAAADDASMWTMVGLSLVCAYLAKTIPELVAGMISGSSAGGGSSLGGMAAAAVAGAAAAAATIATAGAAGAAGAAGGALGASGAGAAAGAAGGGLGGGGLAAAINSSFAGGGGAAAAGGGASAVGGGSSLGASTGGSAAAKSAGANVGGGSAAGGPSAPAPSSQVSEGVQKAAKEVSKAAQGDGDESKSSGGSAQPQGAAQSAQGGDGSQGISQEAQQPESGTKESGGGVTGHQVANALTRGAGILSAISVPGMEGAAGLSLGAGAPQPMPGAGGGDESMEVKGADMQADVQNVIRPAEAPAMPKTSSSPAGSGVNLEGDEV